MTPKKWKGNPPMKQEIPRLVQFLTPHLDGKRGWVGIQRGFTPAGIRGTREVR